MYQDAWFSNAVCKLTDKLDLFEISQLKMLNEVSTEYIMVNSFGEKGISYEDSTGAS